MRVCVSLCVLFSWLTSTVRTFGSFDDPGYHFQLPTRSVFSTASIIQALVTCSCWSTVKKRLSNRSFDQLHQPRVHTAFRSKSFSYAHKRPSMYLLNFDRLKLLSEQSTANLPIGFRSLGLTRKVTIGATTLSHWTNFPPCKHNGNPLDNLDAFCNYCVYHVVRSWGRVGGLKDASIESPENRTHYFKNTCHCKVSLYLLPFGCNFMPLN